MPVAAGDVKLQGRMWREEIRGTGKQRISEWRIASNADAVKRQLNLKLQGRMWREEIRGTGKQQMPERRIASDTDAVKRQLCPKLWRKCGVKASAVLE